MRLIAKRTFLAVSLFLAGFLCGALLVGHLVFSAQGERLAARLAGITARWANASRVPTWTLAIDQAPLPEPAPEPVTIAKKDQPRR